MSVDFKQKFLKMSKTVLAITLAILMMLPNSGLVNKTEAAPLSSESLDFDLDLINNFNPNDDITKRVAHSEGANEIDKSVSISKHLDHEGKKIHWKIVFNPAKERWSNNQMVIGIPKGISSPKNIKYSRNGEQPQHLDFSGLEKIGIHHYVDGDPQTGQNFTNEILKVFRGQDITNFTYDYNLDDTDPAFQGYIGNFKEVISFSNGGKNNNDYVIEFETDILNYNLNNVTVGAALRSREFSGRYYRIKYLQHNITYSPVVIKETWINGPLHIQGHKILFKNKETQATEFFKNVDPFNLKSSEIKIIEDGVVKNEGKQFEYGILAKKVGIKPDDLVYNTPNYDEEVSFSTDKGYPEFVVTHTYKPLEVFRNKEHNGVLGKFYGVTAVRNNEETEAVTVANQNNRVTNKLITGMEVDFTVPASARQGDMFYLKLPETFYWNNDGIFTVYSQTGEPFAHYYIDGVNNTVTFVLTDYIEKYNQDYKGKATIPTAQYYRPLFTNDKENKDIDMKWTAYSIWGEKDYITKLRSPLDDRELSVPVNRPKPYPNVANPMLGSNVTKFEGRRDRFNKKVKYYVLFNPRRDLLRNAKFIDSMAPMTDFSIERNESFAKDEELFLKIDKNYVLDKRSASSITSKEHNNIKLRKIKKGVDLSKAVYSYDEEDLEDVPEIEETLKIVKNKDYTGSEDKGVQFYYSIPETDDAYLLEFDADMDLLDWAMADDTGLYNQARIIYTDNEDNYKNPEVDGEYVRPYFFGDAFIGNAVFPARGEIIGGLEKDLNDTNLVIKKFNDDGQGLREVEFTATNLSNRDDVVKTLPLAVDGYYEFKGLKHFRYIKRVVLRDQNGRDTDVSSQPAVANYVNLDPYTGKKMDPNNMWYSIKETKFPKGHVENRVPELKIAYREELKLVILPNNSFAVEPNEQQTTYLFIDENHDESIVVRNTNEIHRIDWENKKNPQPSFVVRKENDLRTTLEGISFTLSGARNEVKVTDKDGLIFFDNLKDGNYTLTETALGKWEGKVTKANPTTFEVKNGEIIVNGKKIKTIFEPYIITNKGLPTGLGDYVWIDTNKDGIQDGNEEGINEVKVKLQVLVDNNWVDASENSLYDDTKGFDNNPKTTENVKPFMLTKNVEGDQSETDPNKADKKGYYSFKNLKPGTYRTVFELNDEQKEQYSFTTLNGADDTLNSDAIISIEDSSIAHSNPVVLSGGDFNPNIDAGLISKLDDPVSLGDYVWLDDSLENRQKNKNGVQDPGEQGVSGVKVTLYIRDNDTKEFRPAKASEVMFNDQGVKTNDDKTLLNDEEVTILTNTEGKYVFKNLKPGDYKVAFELGEEHSNYLFTKPNSSHVDANDEKDSDAFVVGDENSRIAITEVINLISRKDKGENELDNPTIDAGVVYKYKKSVSLGDKFWIDENRDGKQDEDEKPVVNAKVILLKENGEPATVEDVKFNSDPIVGYDNNPVSTDSGISTVTDANGNYAFKNIKEGKYKVKFEIPENLKEKGYTFTDKNKTDDESNDSNVNDEGITDIINLLYKEDKQEGELDNPTIDAGVVKPLVSLGDYVFVDNNKDGLQDAEDTPLEGVVVKVYTEDGGDPTYFNPETKQFVTGPLEVTTDDKGKYSFKNLVEGSYKVKFELTEDQKAKYNFTTKDSGEDEALDSDADPVTGESGVQAVVYKKDKAAGELDNPNFDAGVVLKEKPVTPEDPEKPVTPEDPEKPVTPEDPEKPVTPEDPEKPVTPEDPEKPVVEIPNTGDNSNIYYYIFTMLMSLLGIGFYSNKRNRKE